MSVLMLFELGAIPAMLIVLGGILIGYLSPPGVRERRLSFYFLSTAGILLLAVFASSLLTPWNDNRFLFEVTNLLAPALVGLLALALLGIKNLRGLSSRGKYLSILLGVVIVALLAGFWMQPVGYAQVILLGAILLAAAWAVGSRSQTWMISLSLAALAGLIYANMANPNGAGLSLPGWLSMTIGAFVFYLIPALSVVLPAILVLSAIQSLSPAAMPHPNNQIQIWPAVVKFALAGFLLAGLAYSIYWLSIWDQTSDGFGGAWFGILAGLVAIGSGMFMGVTTTGRRRAAGLIFGPLVVLVMITASQPQWLIYHAITEERAARIQAALERFRARSGSYPTSLDALVPRDLLWIPGPVLFQGYGWCYQAGASDYRLGAAYRAYFSSPIWVRVYASSGPPAAGPWACDRQAEELKARYTPPPLLQGSSGIPSPGTAAHVN